MDLALNDGFCSEVEIPAPTELIQGLADLFWPHDQTGQQEMAAILVRACGSTALPPTSRPTLPRRCSTAWPTRLRPPRERRRTYR